MQSGRSLVPATSEYNRFPTRRPCIHPVRPNVIQVTERAQRMAYTKNFKKMGDSVPSSTQGLPFKNSKLAYTKNEVFMVGER